MAFPKSLKTNWIVKSYDTTGKASSDLNPFEFAILDADTYTSLSPTEVQGKDILFAVGSPNTGQKRMGLKLDRLDNSLNSEMSFKSQNIAVNALKTQKFTQDDRTNIYYLGSATDTCNSLVFECGKTYEFDVYLKGRPVRNIFGQEFREVIQVTTPCCSPCTDGDCSETIECNVIIDELVKNFNDPNRWISRFYTAEKVVSCTGTGDEPSTETFVTYCLTVCDNGDEIALANVQNSLSSPYTNSKVTVKERNAPYTTYQVTEPQSGDGQPDAFEQDATVLVDCNECPSGFTLVQGGYGYIIEISQVTSPEVSLATLQALNGLSTLTSRSLTGWNGVLGVYYVTSSALLTTSEDAKIVKYLGVTQTTCTQDTATSTPWYECGECYKVVRFQEIKFGSNECDASADVVAAWQSFLNDNPDLFEESGIALTEDGCFWEGLVGQYSNCIEDGCDTVGAPVWEAVPTFLGFTWTDEVCAETTLPTGCSCAIKFTGRSFDDLSELLQLPVYDMLEYTEKDPVVLSVGLLVPDGQTQVCDQNYPPFVQTQFATFRTLHGRDVAKEVIMEHLYRAEPFWNLTDKEALLLQAREGLKYGVDVNAYYFAITISGNVIQNLNYTTSNYSLREDVVLFIHQDDVVLYEALKGMLAGAFPNAKFTELLNA